MALTVHGNPARVVISSGLDCGLEETGAEKKMMGSGAAELGPRRVYISFDDPVADASTTQGSGSGGSQCASSGDDAAAAAPPRAAAAGGRTALRSKASAFVPCAALWAPAMAWPPLPPPPPGLCFDPAEEAPEPTVDQMIEVEGITTLMLRNIPPSFTRAELADLLDSLGLAGLYDFVYVPMSLSSQRNVGYGFVNLTCPAAAHRFCELFEGFRGWPSPPEEPSSVSRSQVQGLTDNTYRYQNSPIMSSEVPDEYKPALFCNGERVPFPEPTKAVKKPKVRKGGRY